MSENEMQVDLKIDFELESVFLWSDGAWCFESEIANYLAAGRALDYELVPVGSPAWHKLVAVPF